jgi:YARHG domain
MIRLKRSIFLLLIVFSICPVVWSQIGDDKEFGKYKWDKFDFSKKKVTKAQLAKLKYEQDDLEPTNELAIVRGILFGKRGRIFKEKSIQSYLEKQSWYKPNANFRNSMLTATERTNLDLIRLAEAGRHNSVEPGDLRYWINKEIPEEKVYSWSAADWSILIAEFEAIHGKTFPDQEWLQKYFDERYWYKRNPNYSSAVLTAIERKNLELFIKKRNEDRKVEVSFGDMDKFQKVLLKVEQLKGLNLKELRSMRNEFFARNGKSFTVAAYKQDFEWQDWYKPLKDQSKVKLNAIEEQNVKLIQGYEAKIRERLTTEVWTEDDVSGLYVEDLRILRNEIFAKHGRVFKDPKLQKYFEAQPWYKADATFTDDKVSTVLTETEFKNVSTIKSAEEYAISKFVIIEG